MAVTLDAAGTSKTGTATSATYSGLTVGAGSNRVLVLAISWIGDPGAISVIRWDDGGTNQTLTQIQTRTGVGSPGGQITRLYGLVAPTSGLKNLQVTWTTSREYAMNAVAWTGANQTGGSTSFPNSSNAGGSSTLATITITIPTNGAGVSNLVAGNGSVLSAVSATQLYRVSGVGNFETGGSYSTSSGTFTGTLPSSDDWAIVATGIAEAATATVNTECMAYLPPRRGSHVVNITY